MSNARRLITPLLLALLVGCATPYVPATLPDRPTTPEVQTATEPSRAQAFAHHYGHFPGAAGVELFEQAWLPHQAPTAVLVIVHGLKDHSSRYERTARALVERGYGVYAFDLRGHAHSAGQRVQVEQFDDYLADLQIFIERVREQHPAKPILLFGHSMGGAIATRFVQQHPDQVQGLALSAAALQVNESAITLAGTRMLASLMPAAPLFNLDLEEFSRDPNVVKAGLSDPLVYQGAAPVHTARELINTIEAIQADFSAVRLPLLIMHGTADSVTPPQGSEALYQQASSTHKRLKLYEGLAHDLLREPEKDRVIQDLADWMKEVERL